MTDQGQGPLAGLRILEFDARDTVPLTGMMLADMGADVIRIRREAADAGDAIPTLYRGRGELILDLAYARDREAALALIDRADALIEGFAPGMMETMGLGPDICLERNPRLAYCRVSPWGRIGPLAGRQASDINVLSLSGALHAIGPAAAPVPPLALIGDFASGGLMMATGLVAAVLSAQATGVGQVVDVAKLGGVATLMSMYYSLHGAGYWPDVRAANMTDGGAPFYRCYACADAKHVAVGALEPHQFAALCDGLGVPRQRFAQYDRAAWEAMAGSFAEIFAGRARDAWEAHFAGGNACVTPVLSLAEAPHHPQNQQSGVFGAPLGMLQPMPAPGFSATPSAARARDRLSVADALVRWC
jgi:alpha-methylacyl-CoA racemase